MRKNIHPYLYQTIIQHKDGSTFLKNWLFLKSFLMLEKDINSHSIFLEKKKNKKKNANITTNN